MGVKIYMSDNTPFFKKVVPSLVADVQYLQTLGITANVTFFSVKFTTGDGKVVAAAVLPVSASKFMKGEAMNSDAVKAHAELKAAIDLLKHKHGGMPAGSFAGKVSAQVDVVKAKSATPNPAAPPMPGAAVPLVAATMVGQKVKGTSPDSVYRATAISQTVKVGTRISSKTLSIRVEGELTIPEVTRLKEMGFSHSTGSHWSLHVSCGNVPVSQVYGGLLLRMGVEFEQVIKSEQELLNAGY